MATVCSSHHARHRRVEEETVVPSPRPFAALQCLRVREHRAELCDRARGRLSHGTPPLHHRVRRQLLTGRILHSSQDSVHRLHEGVAKELQGERILVPAGEALRRRLGHERRPVRQGIGQQVRRRLGATHGEQNSLADADTVVKARCEHAAHTGGTCCVATVVLFFPSMSA